MMERFGNPIYVLARQPRPGEREMRFRPAKDRAFQRPREEEAHV